MYLQHWLLYRKNDVPPFVVFLPERTDVNFCKINNILLIPGHKAVGEASNKFFSYVFLFKLFCMPLTYHANARNHSLGIKLQISGHVPVIHAC